MKTHLRLAGTVTLTVLVLASLALLGAREGKLPAAGASPSPPPGAPTANVKRVEDFDLKGDGTHPSWARAEWIPLRKRSAEGHPYETKIKVLASKTGLYVLMDATDARVTSRMSEDFLDLWKEDVFEVFLWTDERHSLYFEYEISPRGFELPILVPNFEGKFLGWRPWHYEGSRKTRKATAARGGPLESEAAISGWSAEVFIPFELLSPLQNVPPAPGSKWRANFYRVDHDGGKSTGWDWAPVGPSFHEIERFGTLVFE